jgi:short-subunit dehydrogenase
MLGTPNMVPYSATKFALTGFMEGLHYELKNNKVYCILYSTVQYSTCT